MKKVLKDSILILCTSGLLVTSNEVMSSGFQLWEQDGASIANYHAGYAAWANDASTAFYNPAGMTRIKTQQLVIAGVAIPSTFKYKGNVTVIEPIGEPVTFSDVVAQGGTFNFVPSLHYVAPITDCIGFGFSIAVPFGLKTDYGRNTPLKYAATLTSISVIDFSPSLAFQLTDQFSVGAGFNVQKVDAEFDSVGVITLIPGSDSESQNDANGTGYGYHLGILYQFSPQSRVGLSYHSQVVHHLSGTSKFTGPLPDIINDGMDVVSNRATTRITLPAYTALSFYHSPNCQWGFMASVIYTQWNIFKTLALNNVAGAVFDPELGPVPSTTIKVAIPQFYRNTWNVSLGADYYVNERITLRGGIGYDQTPVNNAYRNVQLPDQDRYIISFGGHYQATNTLGFDLGWSHLFMANVAKVNPPPQVAGAQTVETNGRVRGGANVLGAQITWNL